MKIFFACYLLFYNMIKLNKKIKYGLNTIVLCSISSLIFNLYRKQYGGFELNLDDIYEKEEFKSQEKKEENLDPFELIENFDREEYLIDRIKICLYNPPLTNKLYPKSNLYGHELIRYFDK
jgi:hypothetical protein